MKYYFFVTLFFTLVACSGNQRSMSVANRNFPFEDPQTQAKVESLMANMTDDEKIMQLCGIRPTELLDADRKFSVEQCRKKIPNGIGHVSQFASSMGLPP
ncbi:MAG: hypothetical protein LBR49_06215, partial [Tannerella sp.]|nr:hypothetical protein [Tannerella sp.]